MPVIKKWSLWRGVRSIALLLFLGTACACLTSIFLFNISNFPLVPPRTVKLDCGTHWDVHGPAPIYFFFDRRVGFNQLHFFQFPSVGSYLLMASGSFASGLADIEVEDNEWMRNAAPPPHNSRATAQSMLIRTVGLPFATLRCRLDTIGFVGGGGAITVVGGLQYPGTEIIIPLTPVWPGIIYNLIIWSFGVWLVKRLLIDRFKLRQSRIVRNRLRQSRCLSCGYPVADLIQCPECGSAAGGTKHNC